MKETQSHNYYRIAKAIEYVKKNFKQQPSIEEVAAKVCLSPFHFQRLFHQWAGITPKKFLQYISIKHAKQLLKQEKATLFDTTFEIGLSSTSRLHDLFINIEGMTPAQYKNGGKELQISYSYAETPFGNIMVASTPKGICAMYFFEKESYALNSLKKKYPNATLTEKTDLIQQNALLIFQKDWKELPQIKLHLKGTPFQLKVWETLLKIPMGKLSTYKDIAEQIGNPKASRAVGSAIGSNPIAFLIPCHRIIKSTGDIGGYMWGDVRKTAMIAWESARTEV